MSTHHADHTRITLRNALGYALGDAYGGGAPQLSGMYLAVFWTHFCGFSIAAAQGFIGAAAIISSISAIVFGTLSERFYRCRIGRRFGRRRFFILLTSPLVLVTLLMWVPGLPKPVYFLVYVLYVMLMQMFGVCYAALPTEMTDDFSGRSLLSTVRLLISGLSAAAIPMLASLVLSRLGEDHAFSYQLFVTIVTVIFAVVTFVCSRVTWELTPKQAGYDPDEMMRDRGARHHRSFAEWWAVIRRMAGEYASTMRVATFRRHLAMYLICLTLVDTFTQTFVFFVIYDLGKTAAFASMLLSLAIIAEVFKPLWGWLFVRVGPRALYGLCCGGAFVGVGLLFLTWRMAGYMGEPAWTALAMGSFVVWSVFRSLSGTLPWLNFPFIPDVDAIMTRRNRASLFSGLTTFLRFMCLGLGSMLCGVFLSLAGFVPDQVGEQTATAQGAIAFVCLGWTVIGFAVVWLISRRFELNQRTDLIVLHETDRLRKGGSKAAVDPETKAVVERLTGHPYEDCWR